MSTNNYQQQSLFKEQRLETRDSGPETCLGMEFPNSEARRAHFTEELRKKLQDPEFRKIEGFPIGSDEDILNLSDPPYYTACPNPWIADFIAQWEKEKKVARVREWLSMKSVGQAFRPALNFPEIREFQKKDLDYVHQYQRRLPHWELPGSSYFITFRSHKSVGQPFQAANAANAKQPSQQKSVGQAFQPANTAFQPANTAFQPANTAFQPANTFQPASQLNMPNLLEEALWFFHQERYLLDAYVIMPDHVHLLIRPMQGNTLAKIMQGLKGYTARELNKIMKRKGSFWQDENFDHLIRNGADWLDKFEYIHNNPVNAGLVENPEDYPYSSLVTLHAEGRLESLPHTQLYHREPFAADVSEGKNDPIYNAHSYHTKVPHKAIMRYILHYTQPGDIVFDGFCGTGMTGVAAQMCGDREVVMSLGYQVKPDGTILQEETDEDGKKVWKPFSKLGVRRAVLNDLSPAATFIAYNYNTPINITASEKEAKKTLMAIEKNLGWIYETRHSDGRVGKINYTVWSDVFICPNCAGDVVFWTEAVDKDLSQIHDEFNCPHCSTKLNKRGVEHAWIIKYDEAIKETVRQIKQVPVLINYAVGGKRFVKTPDASDLALVDKINREHIPFKFPTTPVPKGDKTGEPLRIGITHAHHFYTRRNLWVLATLWNGYRYNPRGRLALTSVLIKTASLLHNIGLKNGKINLAGALPNAMYIPSNLAERNLFQLISGKIDDFSRANLERIKVKQVVTLGSFSSPTIGNAADHKFDYIFVDPPFGSNLHYSELSFLWEAWLRIVTNNEHEAIENKTQGKKIDDYRALMTSCFKQAYSSLKPGRWMTVEFSNTSSSVWNSIQTALNDAGFVVGNVSVLHKGQGTFNAQTNPTSVKQDLVISAYKPNGGFEERFLKEAQTEEGVWDFVRTHLKYLPVTKAVQVSKLQSSKTGDPTLNHEHSNFKLVFVPERDPRILFDQMVAFYVRKGYPVPISSQEFQIGLAQRFIERDGMYFLPDQVAEYDRKKMTSGEPRQMTMFVSDEASAIQWLRQLIKVKPQTFSDINPQFMQQLGGWSKNEAQLDLRELLSQNFICYDGKGPVPEQIHAYLSTNWKELRNLPKDDPALIAKARDRWYVPDPNKAGDLEKLREKALLKEFEEYVGQAFSLPRKKLKVFRLEAVRAGFKKAWQERNYAVIVTVADKIPNNVLEEDPKLLMWFDQAVTRMGS